jgi:hypothetical protein
MPKKYDIKNMSDERLREKLDYWLDKQNQLEQRHVNFAFSYEYIKACRNYVRYLREWAKRQIYE